MTDYWLGDPHLFHLKVAGLRGFSCPEEHNEFLMDQLSVVKDQDTIYFLGDLSSGRAEQEEMALELISTVRGTKHLIAGNHDSVSSVHKNGWKRQPRFLEVFDSVRDFGRFALERENVLMSHYPYVAMGDGDGRRDHPRYAAYRLPDTGLPLVHAHTHQSHPFSRLREATISPVAFEGYDLNSMCVSWDARRGLTTDRDMSLWILARDQVKRERELERVQGYWGAFPKPEAVTV